MMYSLNITDKYIYRQIKVDSMTEENHRKEPVYLKGIILLPDVPYIRGLMQNDKEDLARMLSIRP